jgi:hypothetical protein
LSTAETLVIDDYEQIPLTQSDGDGGFNPPHEGVRSSLVTPITCQDRVVGLIHLHSKTPHLFDQVAIEISEALALQSAVALNNVYRFQKQTEQDDLLQQRVEVLGKLLGDAPVLQADQPLDESLNKIAQAIQSSTPFNSVLISVYDPISERLLRVASAGVPDELMGEIKQHTQPWESIQALLKTEFLLGHCYFIPHEKMPVKPVDLQTVDLLAVDTQATPRSTLSWHPQDLLLIPLTDPEGKPWG